MAAPPAPPDPSSVASSVLQEWRDGGLPPLYLYKPVASEKHKSDRSLPAGPGRLQALFQRFLSRATSQQVADLLAWIRYEAPRPFRVGTMCSGTDCPLPCWRASNEAVHDIAGLRLQWSPAFASRLRPTSTTSSIIARRAHTATHSVVSRPWAPLSPRPYWNSCRSYWFSFFR